LNVSALKDITGTQAEQLLPEFRRIVLLGSIDDPQYASALGAKFESLTEEELRKLEVWEEGFDDLTGTEIRCKLEKFL
jgi:hypothetical protein